MNKKIWVYIVILVIVLAAGVYVFSTNNQKQAVPAPQASNAIQFPVALDSSVVNSAFLYYNFKGTVKSTETDDAGLKVTLDSNDLKIPILTVSKTVKINKVSKTAVSAATLADIKQGTLVTIGAYYDLKAKIWYVSTVYIQ